MTHQQEEWRVVQSLDGRYLVSNSGEVMTTARCVFRRGGKSALGNPQTVREKVLRGCVAPSGYRVFRLSAEGKERNFFAHVLVAEAFLEKPDWAECVNHVDGNKLNNHVENLEWVTVADNSRHGWRTGLYFSNQRTQFRSEKLRPKDFLKIKELYGKGMKQREIAAIYGICRPYVSMIVNDKVNGAQLSLPLK